MNKAVPWSVKGVGFDAREAARQAAKRAGLPIGEWLNSVIADRAAEVGVGPEDIDGDARLEAVAARLADLSNGLPQREAEVADRDFAVAETIPRVASIKAGSNRSRAWSEASGMDRLNRAPIYDDGAAAEPPKAVREPDRAQREDLRDWEVDSLLDQAAERMERRALAAIERSAASYRRETTSALAAVSERISKAEAGRGAEYDALARITDRLVGLEQQVTNPPETAYRPLKDALGSVAERLSELETRVTQRDADAATKPIVSALSRLEDRFERFAKRSTENRDSARLEATVQDLNGRLAEMAEKLERTQMAELSKADTEIERIDSKLASILDRLNTPRSPSPAPAEMAAMPRPGSIAAKPAPVAEAAPVLPSPPAVMQKTLGNAIADIARRQADLDGGMTRRPNLMDQSSHRTLNAARRDAAEATPALLVAERQAPGPLGKTKPSRQSGARERGDFELLQDAFKALSDRLEARLDDAARTVAKTSDRGDFASLQKEIAGLTGRFDLIERDPGARFNSAGADEIAAIKHDIAALSEGLADLAPTRSVSALERAVRDLAERVEASRDDGVQESVLAPVERLGAEILQAVRSIDPRSTCESLQRDIKAVAARVDGLGTTGVDPAALQSIQQQTREMRDLLTQAANRPLAVDRIEHELTQLAERVDQLADTPPRRASRDLERSIGDIRGMLDRFSPDSFLDALERKMQGFAGKIEALQNGSAPLERLDDLARRLDDVHEKVTARATPDAAAKADLRPLEAMLGSLSGKLDTLHTAAADTKSLNAMVRDLAARLDDAHAAQSDAKALDAIESQVTRLAERLDRSDANLTAMSSLEHTVRDLFQQLEDTRNLAVDAAESAARTAAQDTLRAALSNPSLNGSDVTARAGLAVEHVNQELSNFRQAQDLADRRVNATLAALNTTLERLVDRMVTQAAAADTKPKAAVPVKAPSPETMRKRMETRADFEADPFLLEPGTGMVPERGGGERPAPAQAKAEAPSIEVNRAAAPDVAPLIAAARRAAQAAQASAAAASGKDPMPRVRGAAADTSGASVAQRARSFLAKRRRPLLLSLAGIVLLLGAVQIVKLTADGRKPAVEASVTADDVAPVAPSAARAGTPAPASSAATGRSDSALLAPPDSGARTTTAFNPPASTQAVDSPARVAAATPAKPAAADPSLAGLGAGLRDLALQGDAAAQFEVAVRFADGRSVNRDPKAAAVWFGKAANQGLAPAEYRLGSLYEKGIGVAIDPSLALAWYEKAAAQGNVRAMHNLAVMAAEGSGGKPDYAKAATWFTKAANLGVRDSQFNLAILYARGLGIEQNLSQSYAWFAVAASQGDADAAKKRDEVGSKLDAKTLAAAKAVADNFHAATPDRAANEVLPPPGGWDAVAPGKTAPGTASKDTSRLLNVSSM